MKYVEEKQKIIDSSSFRILLVSFLVILALFIVYIKDGTSNVYAHLIYMPIIISAYYWGFKGGVSVAIISGILLGPFIPLSISEGIMQSFTSWITRLCIFALVGFITGYLFKVADKLNREAHERNFVSPFTGIYNTNKLFIDLENRMNKGEVFAIVSMKFTNVEGISKYLKYKFGESIINDFIKELLKEYGDTIYSTSSDEIVLITSLECGYLEKCNDIIKKYLNPIKIDNITYQLSLKTGIYEYLGSIETPIEVFNKARIAYEQGSEMESGIYYYNDEANEHRKEFYEISGSLIDSINNKELYLVYQPKINILDNIISGVEILIRWDRGDKIPVGPSVFIKIAEDIGFIKEISKFVFENANLQRIDWIDKGIKINLAMNFTVKELLDEEFKEWVIKTIKLESLDRNMFEIEITERDIYYDSEKIIERLNELKEMGYQVSIDDFGTGHNSFIKMMEIPYDQLKIDKYFIDRIDQIRIRELVQAIISYSHRLNKTVVAEGVETEEQLNVLRELNCDIVHGYYYSKPLLPHEFEKYYFEFYDKENRIIFDNNASKEDEEGTYTNLTQNLQSSIHEL